MKKILIITVVFFVAFINAQADWGLFGSMVTTNSVSNIGLHDAYCNYTITLIDGDPAITQRGVVWCKTSGPTLGSSCLGYGYTEEGAGPSNTTPVTYDSHITELQNLTLYYVRAYAVNTEGTFYGNEMTFTTVPTLPEWGLIALISLSGIIGGWFVWKKYV